MISLITGVGAPGQVGEAVAAALARRGDTVLLVDRVAERVQERARDLTDAGLRADAYGCDLTSEAAVADLAARVQRGHGDRLDALVNLAGGFGMSGPIEASDPAMFSRQIAINLTTSYLATRAMFPLIRAARGSIVYFASEAVLGVSSTSGMAAYVAAKAGVAALMRSVADEGRAHGVRANALAPAAIRTRANEAAMRRDTEYVEREDVAAAVAFLCSPEARAVTSQILRLR